MRAIEIDNVSKQYRLGDTASLRALVQRSATQVIWALRDVTLDIDEGEVVGFVGRNGAGKSTLLRILANITEPTEGVTRTRGRVGTLLDVGTGFHGELTGRENILVNGALLGLRRREILARFDDIVDFAGVGRFIDTPLKRYSSGMQLRLAFAIAAEIEPEIVVVDEVLAVGDAEFQQRCLQRMGDMHRSGRTVLFVSHDTGTVAQLCTRVVWLEGGSVAADGRPADVIAAYLASSAGRRLSVDIAPRDDLDVFPVSVTVSSEGPAAGLPSRDRPLHVDVELEAQKPGPADLDLAVIFTTPQGARIVDEAWSDHRTDQLSPDVGARRRIRMTLAPALAAGTYGLTVWLGDRSRTWFEEQVLQFQLGPAPGDTDESVRRVRVVQPASEWSVT